MNAQGHVLRLSFTDLRVFIPLVCKRCGECCRKVGVHPGAIDIFAAAEYLGISAKELVETYIGKVISCDKKRIKYEASIRHPCPFLKENKCLIYPVRPGVCKAFPVETDGRDRGIGCPAMREVRRAWRALGEGSVEFFDGKVCLIPPKKWDKILAKYRRSHPSKEALELFIRFNRPSLQP